MNRCKPIPLAIAPSRQNKQPDELLKFCPLGRLSSITVLQISPQWDCSAASVYYAWQGYQWGCFRLQGTQYPTKSGLYDKGHIPRTTSRGRKCNVNNKMLHFLRVSKTVSKAGRLPWANTTWRANSKTKLGLGKKEGRRAVNGYEPWTGSAQKG